MEAENDYVKWLPARCALRGQTEEKPKKTRLSQQINLFVKSSKQIVSVTLSLNLYRQSFVRSSLGLMLRTLYLRYIFGAFPAFTDTLRLQSHRPMKWMAIELHFSLPTSPLPLPKKMRAIKINAHFNCLMILVSKIESRNFTDLIQSKVAWIGLQNGKDKNGQRLKAHLASLVFAYKTGSEGAECVFYDRLVQSMWLLFPPPEIARSACFFNQFLVSMRSS